MAESTSETAVWHPRYLVEIDGEATDTDSAYGDEISSQTGSLTSAVLNYRKENGRTYHGYRDGKYLFPNDDDENDRLDMVHELYLTIMDRKLFFCPIGESPQWVIDLGCGTGLWAIEMADLYPSAQVIGMDLSPIQPEMVPPNMEFIVDDIEQDGFLDRPFDFAHIRGLACCIKEYKALIARVYENTAPGGWVEVQDWDTRLSSQDDSTEGTSLKQYYDVVLGGFEKAGYMSAPGPWLEGWFSQAGFEQIVVRKFPVPLGPWPKDEHLKQVGLFNLIQAESGFEAAAMAVLTRYEGWSKEEAAVLVANARRDARDRSIHSLFHFYVVYGRKPF